MLCLRGCRLGQVDVVWVEVGDCGDVEEGYGLVDFGGQDLSGLGYIVFVVGYQVVQVGVIDQVSVSVQCERCYDVGVVHNVCIQVDFGVGVDSFVDFGQDVQWCGSMVELVIIVV